VKSIYALTLAIALAMVFPLAAAGQHEYQDAAAMVEAADSPEEHLALAEHYREKAAMARKRAEQHRKMGERYAGPKSRTMREHCDELVVLSEKVADQYDKLAEGHEAEAGQ
jgi:hypothetical protein